MALPIRLSSLGAVSLALAVSLSACTSKGGEVETGPVEIHYQVNYPEKFNQDPVFQDELNALEDFNRTHPNIKAVVDYMPPIEGTFFFTTVDDFIKLLESNEPPDVVSWSPGDIQIAEDKWLLQDLLPLVGSDLDIPQQVLDFGTINGKLLVLPYGARPSGIFYNKELFDQSQVAYPEGEWTWEQFRDVSKKIKAQYGSSLSYEISTLELLMTSMGTGVLSPDGTTSVGYLDSPEAVRAVQWLNAYYRDDEDKTAPMTGFDEFGEFDAQRDGMIIGTLGNRYYNFEGENKSKLGVAPLPYFERGNRANPVGFSGYAISKKSKHPEAAWELIRYLTLEKNEHSLLLAKEYVPTSRKMAEAMHIDSDPVMSVYNDELNYPFQSAGDRNKYFKPAWNDELTAQFQQMLTAKDEEIPDMLHKLALNLDREMERLKIEIKPTGDGTN